MSSLRAILIAWPSMPAAHAALTARKAGCEIAVVKAVSASSVESMLQSSKVHNASGSRLQSVQKRGGSGTAGDAAAPDAIADRSPSAISAAHEDSTGAAPGGVSQPPSTAPKAPTSNMTTIQPTFRRIVASLVPGCEPAA